MGQGSLISVPVPPHWRHGCVIEKRPLRLGLDAAPLAARADRRAACPASPPCRGRSGRARTAAPTRGSARPPSPGRTRCAPRSRGRGRAPGRAPPPRPPAPPNRSDRMSPKPPKPPPVPVRNEPGSKPPPPKMPPPESYCLALLGVGQDRVGLLDLLEALLGVLVAVVRVRVVLARQLAVGLLDLLVGGLLVDAERLVRVLHRRHGYAETTTRAGRSTVPLAR